MVPLPAAGTTGVVGVDVGVAASPAGRLSMVVARCIQLLASRSDQEQLVRVAIAGPSLLEPWLDSDAMALGQSVGPSAM